MVGDFDAWESLQNYVWPEPVNKENIKCLIIKTKIIEWFILKKIKTLI